MTALADRAARRAVQAALRHGVEGGRLELLEGTSRLVAGGPGDLDVSVRIRDPRAYRAVLRGSTGLGEAYAEGWWDTDDLVGTIRLAARSLVRFDSIRARIDPLTGPIRRAATRIPLNTKVGARRHIAAHYDLGNELFGSFLDERMMYSAAWFPEPGASLEAAQLAKLERICDRLLLGPDDHLLEIGSGWGGLALHAAETRGCRVTTTTISREQHDHVADRVRELELTDLVTVLFEDYRDLRGRFDKLVSIEMIEAVGWQYFGSFFRRCSELLAGDGLMFLQAIVIDDRLYEVEKAARSFANTHVFPGGCLPSRRLIGDVVAAETDLRCLWSEEIGPHYSETLRIWRERFEAAWPELSRRGYDERFRRLWRFYLAFCEAGFRERRIGDVQLLYAKPGYRDDDVGAGAERAITA